MLALRPLLVGWLALAVLPLHCRTAPVRATGRGSLASMPRITVWSWARREDLRALDPGSAAVALLDRTVVLHGSSLQVVPQRNAVLLPASPALHRMVVVRIETHDAALNHTTAEEVARAAAEAVQRPGTEALQIDFDARHSERDWYSTVLQRVRAQLPKDKGLSITALASWCSRDPWLAGLPVDEAVPMLFRMEPGVRGAADPEIAIREPLCMGSVGVSTREPWPAAVHARRVYVFPDRGWQRDNVAETVRDLQ